MDKSPSAETARALFEAGLIRTWYRHQKTGWILRSGQWSPFYVQLRPLVSRPELLIMVGKALGALISRECAGATRLVGVAMTGIPLAVAASISSGIPAAYTRKEDVSAAGEHGEHALIEGELFDNDVVVLVDDVVTHFDSKLEASRQLQREADRRGISVRCHDVAVVVDRLQGGFDVIARENMKIHSLVELTAGHLDALRPLLEDTEYSVIEDYLRSPGLYQEASMQSRIASLSRAS
jgi:orotate phosphoribosyltransferase